MQVSFRNFCTKYVTDCFSRELSYKQRIQCLALSILLFPLTLGVLHAYSLYWHNRSVKKLSDKVRIYDENLYRYQNTVLKTDAQYKLTISNKLEIPITQSAMSYTAEQALENYAKPYPKSKDVLVQYEGGQVKWSKLSKDQKVSLIMQHNKKGDRFTSLVPDQLFFGSTSGVHFLKKDPRVSHGKDHAVRVALFGVVFAYLYGKYKNIEISHSDLMEIQVAGLFHDAGRLTDGIDMFEQNSASLAKKYLKSIGTDPKSIERVSNAICAETSSFVGTCLQNADSIDYARLVLKAPDMDQESFDNAFRYLAVSKDSDLCSNSDFLKEFDTVRHEMYQLIWETHNQQVRSQLAGSENYYQAFLSHIDSISYPTLCHILKRLNIIQEMASPIASKPLCDQGQAFESESNENQVLIREYDEGINQLLQEGKVPEARGKLIQAQTIPAWKGNLRYNPEEVFNNSTVDIPYLFGGGSAVRKRRLRYSQTKDEYQITFELRSSARKQWSKRSEIVSLKTVDDGVWNKCLELEHEGISIKIGDNKKDWNTYHLVRMNFSKKTKPQQLHRALCLFGLPTVLLPDRSEDIEGEAKARMKAFAGENTYDPSEISIKSGEVINHKVPLKAYKQRARGFMSSVRAGDSTVDVVVSILKEGYLSYIERRLRGIDEHGNNPSKLLEAGSANHVFTRLLMKDDFKKKTSLSNFSVDGPVTILYDISLFEKLPYSYTTDCMGVRNPHFSGVQFAQNQFPQNLNGKDVIEKRPNFEQFLGEIKTNGIKNRESMFDCKIEPEYINRIVVMNQEYKINLKKKLVKENIQFINGKPLDEAIIVSETLDPSML